MSCVIFVVLRTLIFPDKVLRVLALTKKTGASLVAQWLRICLLMQGTRVRALAWEDPTCRGAAGPVSHSCWACASGACAPQRERPAHRDEEWPPLAATGESPCTETKTQHSQNQSINQSIKHTHLIQDPH